MMKKFRAVKATALLGFLLIGMLAAVPQNASAGLVKLNPTLLLTYTSASDDRIVPTSGKLDINLTLNFALYGTGSSLLEQDSLLSKSALQVTLSIEGKEDWIDASIENPVASIAINPDSRNPWTNSKLHVTITGQAPAFTLGQVKIRATSAQINGLLFSIQSVYADFTVSFQVGYWPVVQYNPISGNLLQTTPTDTADFAISLTNTGNYVTYVQITPLDIPEGWSVSVPSSVTLGSPVIAGSGPSVVTVHVRVKPPYGFGFHNDAQHFQLQFSPSCQGHSEFTGQTEIMTFNVQSVGFSPGGGFEIPLIIIILVVIGIVLYLFIKFIKNRKK